MTIDHPLPAAVTALRAEEATADHVRMAADQAGELIRYLNYATQSWTARVTLPSPADTMRMIGALHEITQHLQQTLDRAGERITVVGPGSEEARHAARHLRSAREALRETSRHLAQAHAAAVQLPG